MWCEGYQRMLVVTLLALLAGACQLAMGEIVMPNWPVAQSLQCDRPSLQMLAPDPAVLYNDTEPIDVDIRVVFPPHCAHEAHMSGIWAVYDARWDRFVSRKAIQLGSPSTPPSQADLRAFSLAEGLRYQSKMPIPQHGTAVRCAC